MSEEKPNPRIWALCLARKRRKMAEIYDEARVGILKSMGVYDPKVPLEEQDTKHLGDREASRLVYARADYLARLAKYKCYNPMTGWQNPNKEID